MEAHSLKRAETEGEDDNLSSSGDVTLRSLIHRHLCTLDVSFVRAKTAGGEGESPHSSKVTVRMC